MLKVLIVEDQPAVVTALQVLFEIRGMACAVARSPEEALKRLDVDAGQEIGVVVQDMNFSPEATTGEEGIALFRETKRRDPALPVLLLTAWTSLETAVQLVKEGASDYLAKPWDDEKLLASVRNLLRLRELQLENARLRGRARRSWEDLAERHDLCGAVWASEKMHGVVTLALQVARGDVPVLITGPSGAGKEKLAEIVQANSRRKEKPFVRVNAGALPDELLESERFGAEAGPHPGAPRRRLGSNGCAIPGRATSASSRTPCAGRCSSPRERPSAPRTWGWARRPSPPAGPCPPRRTRWAWPSG